MMQTMLRNNRDEGDYAITTFKARAPTPGACLTCKLAAKIVEVLGEQLLTSMNKNYDRLIERCDRQLERLGINNKVVDVEERGEEKENMAGSDSTNHSMGPTTCEEEVVEQRVEVDDSCSEQDENKWW